MIPQIRELLNKKKPSKQKVIKCSIIIFLALTVGFYSFYKINQFFETHKFIFQSPVLVHIESPVYIVTRVTEVLTTIVKADEHNTPLTSDQQYVCDKFGSDCKLALAIAHAENGTGQCDRINWSNSNQSLDIGFFQINTLWVDKNKVTPSQLFDCKTNIDFAYQIYKANGNSFKDWSTYNSGAYKKYLY